jgi:hypothetical protein
MFRAAAIVCGDGQAQRCAAHVIKPIHTAPWGPHRVG